MRTRLSLINGGQVTVMFSGLSSSAYALEFVSSSSFGTDIADITIDGNFADRKYENIAGKYGDNWNVKTDGRDQGNWLIWDNVAPTAGSITVLFDLTTTAGGADINAARLYSVPEPASLALLGLGGLVLMRRGEMRTP